MHRILLSLALLILLTFSVAAQAPSLTRFTAPVTVEGQTLAWPFAGGLNNPQPSSADLDNDGDDDLYIFDRLGGAQLAFRTETDGSLTYAPELTVNFPPLDAWALLRDYNGDGIMDIFAYSDAIIDGIMVYQGYYDDDNLLAFNRYQFENASNIIYFPLNNGRINLFVSSIDIPAFDDLDCDGDLDILTFNISGGYMEFYANQSVERGFGLDSLIYLRKNGCYGGIFESGLSSAVDLASAPGECADPLLGPAEPAGPRHSGSTLLTFDANGDGIKDLILGDITFSDINLLTNGGTCQQAWYNDQQPFFPTYDVSLDQDFFPAPFYVDFNNDGKRDLLVSPSAQGNVEDKEVLWYYENTGTDANPVFALQTRTALVEQMIDLGTGARPVPFDYNGDGQLDLVIGNNNDYAGGGGIAINDSQVYLYENTGSPGAPAFTLVDTNYLGLAVFTDVTNSFYPVFGDLDGDGDQDALVGEATGGLLYLENTGGPGQTAVFGQPQFEWMGIDVGLSSVPALADIDGDGLLDLLLGERSGNINYFRNTGTPTVPFFDPSPDAGDNRQQFGGLDLRGPGFSTGYSAPWVIAYGTDSLQVAAGGVIGPVELYGGGISAANPVFSTVSTALGGINFGTRSTPSFGDWDGDGLLEMAVGNYRGGIQFYDTDIVDSPFVGLADRPLELTGITIFPNPAGEQFRVRGLPTGNTAETRLFDASGRLVRRATLGPGASFSVRGLPAGLYFAQVLNLGSGARGTFRVVVR